MGAAPATATPEETPVTADRKRLIREIRRAWALVRRPERRRLQLVAGYGVVIAGLETVALILLFAVITLLDGQQVSGVMGSLLSANGLSERRALPRSAHPPGDHGAAFRRP